MSKAQLAMRHKQKDSHEFKTSREINFVFQFSDSNLGSANNRPRVNYLTSLVSSAFN